MNMSLRMLAGAGILILLSGCSTWSTSSVTPAAGASAQLAAPAAKKAPSQIQVTEDDIADRPYKVLGDIDVTVNKTTLFHEDPTREHVNEQLQAKAAAMGADAVILARYGTVGVGFASWGSLEGKGRAVVFTN